MSLAFQAWILRTRISKATYSVLIRPWDFLLTVGVDTGPLVNSLLWLALHRDSIRKGA